MQSDYIVGFEFLNIPVILNTSPEIITTNYHWGLVPSWSKDIDFRKNTLNARIETIDEKPSFRNSTSNRCLVIATAFFEWHWKDEKSKSKEKYKISSAESELFAFTSYTSPIPTISQSPNWQLPLQTSLPQFSKIPKVQRIS